MEPEFYSKKIMYAAQKPSPNRIHKPHGTAQRLNPFCGDRVSLDVKIYEQKVVAVGIEVKGCIICKAASNIMAECIIGETVENVLKEKESILQFLEGNYSETTPLSLWPEFSIFTPVIKHNSRHECLLLPLETLHEAIKTYRSKGENDCSSSR